MGTIKPVIVFNTDTGRKRHSNEDSIWAEDFSNITLPPIQSIFVVADGMGGHEGGEIASGIVVKYLQNKFGKHNIFNTVPDINEKTDIKVEGFLKNVVSNINDQVRQAPGNNLEAPMATTITLGIQKDNFVYIAHVGDSRAYLIRGQTIEQITKDHSALGEYLELGKITEQEAKIHPYRSQVQRSLGLRATVDIDVYKRQIKPYDYILFCSDGLYDMLDTEEVLYTIIKEKTPQKICMALIDYANKLGGEDNISVGIVYFQGENEKKEQETARMPIFNRHFSLTKGKLSPNNLLILTFVLSGINLLIILFILWIIFFAN